MSTISNFPNGFRRGISLVNTPIVGVRPGAVYWVDATHPRKGDSGSHGSFERPFATLDYAIGRCAAKSGDIIYVAPGHTETITAAGGVTADVAGISIIGAQAYGASTTRPTFYFATTTAASFDITAESVTVENLVFHVDGTNWRTDTTAVTTAVSGTNAAGGSATIDIGPIGPTQQARVDVVLSAEAADTELPYVIEYVSQTAPTITAVAA